MNNLAKELKAVFHKTHLSEDAQWEAIAKRAEVYCIGVAEECPQEYPVYRIPQPPEPMSELKQAALMAMQGLCANPFFMQTLAENISSTAEQYEFIGKNSVNVAQATLAKVEEE